MTTPGSGCTTRGFRPRAASEAALSRYPRASSASPSSRRRSTMRVTAYARSERSPRFRTRSGGIPTRRDLGSMPRYPSLYQINTRVWLTELSRTLGRAATLDDVPDAALDHLAEQGFDWVWFLSVWQTGPAAQAISRANPEWRREFVETLPGLNDEDIAGSGFAIQNYIVHRDLGGDAALARLRQRLHA